MERKIISAEVCRKLLALNGHCVQLLAQAYPTEGAHTLIRLLQKIVAAMQERFDSYNKKQIVLVGSLCSRFEQYIGYVDSSKMHQVPWSILPALEKLFQNIRPNCQFMICPIWQTNYAIYNSNIIQEIKTKIIEVPGLLFDHDDSFINKVESFVADMPAGLYFLFYPRLERLSVLHFSLLGHEIGHIIADEWLQKKWEEFLAQFEIEKTLSKHFEKRFDVRFEVFKQPVIKRQVAEAIEHFEKILKELLSDIFGGLIFGPPSLFSYYVFALNSQLV